MTKKILLPMGILSVLLSVCSYAQVPVSEEPLHRKVFQNEYVRILDVHLQPGDTSLFHKHELPSVFIVLNNAKTGSELIKDGTTENAPVTYGNIWFDGFYIKPRIHRVWNSDTVEFHVMDIELLKNAYKEIDSPRTVMSMQMLFNEKPVRAYKSVLKANSRVKAEGSKYPLLVVGLSSPSKKVKINNTAFEKKGDFLFIPAGEKSTYINEDNVATDFAIFELK